MQGKPWMTRHLENGLSSGCNEIRSGIVLYAAVNNNAAMLGWLLLPPLVRSPAPARSKIEHAFGRRGFDKSISPPNTQTRTGSKRRVVWKHEGRLCKMLGPRRNNLDLGFNMHNRAIQARESWRSRENHGGVSFVLVGRRESCSF